jgi:four helix bundle protein
LASPSLKLQEAGMTDSVLRNKSKEFAKSIVFLCRRLKQNNVEAALINQLLRSGTSVGANVHEAQYAQGTKDFISKFEIALKECNESEYWLELLYETGSIIEEEFKNHQKLCIELRRMLISSITTLKEKSK